MKERVIELTKQGLTKEQIFEVLKSEGATRLAKAADKLTLNQRRRFVKESFSSIESQAVEYTKNTDWVKADQPIQYLKGAKDYVQASNSIISSIRILFPIYLASFSVLGLTSIIIYIIFQMLSLSVLYKFHLY